MFVSNYELFLLLSIPVMQCETFFGSNVKKKKGFNCLTAVLRVLKGKMDDLKNEIKMEDNKTS